MYLLNSVFSPQLGWDTEICQYFLLDLCNIHKHFDRNGVWILCVTYVGGRSVMHTFDMLSEREKQHTHFLFLWFFLYGTSFSPVFFSRAIQCSMLTFAFVSNHFISFRFILVFRLLPSSYILCQFDIYILDLVVWSLSLVTYGKVRMVMLEIEISINNGSIHEFHMHMNIIWINLLHSVGNVWAKLLLQQNAQKDQWSKTDWSKHLKLERTNEKKTA